MHRISAKPPIIVTFGVILALLFGMIFSFPVSASDISLSQKEASDLAGTGASKLILNKSSLTLDLKQEYKIIAFDSATKASVTTMSFSSSNTSVVTVSAKGIVKGIKAGTATITAKDTKLNRSASCKITVTNQTYVPPEARNETLTVSPSTATIFKGGSYELSVSGNASRVSYSSSNTSVATVSSSGVIKGVGIGSATITVKSTYKSATCTVNVISGGGSSGNVHISNTSASMPAGKTLLLRSTTAGVSWSSSDTSIATVSGGYVVGKRAGTVTIYASTSSGYASCVVTVSAAAPIRFAYCSPNCATIGQKVSFIAITDQSRTAACFKIYYSDGSTKLVSATSKSIDGNNYVWTGYGTFSAYGAYKVVAYSKISGSWQTCADGTTSAFVVNSKDKTTTVCAERRASDEVISLIATFEGFLSDIYNDPWTGDPTIGYGRVIFTGQQFYNHLTKREAFAYLVQTVNNDGYATKMNEFLLGNKVKYNQQQFDALVCLVYNTGTGVVTGDDDVKSALLNCSNGGGSSTTYYINGSGVRLRQGPGTNTSIIMEMDYGTVITIIQKTSSSWYKVKLTNGTVGYVSTDYISSRTTGGNLDLNYVNKQNLIKQICQYHHAGGECVWGLLYRRIDEMEMFFYGDYDPCYGDYKYNISFTCKNNPYFHT